MNNQHIRYMINPTDTQRYQILGTSLEMDQRSEDLENIITSLNPPADISYYAAPGEFKSLKVGVIGAGLAGLAAAFELRKTGADITIFDALEDRVGGRVYTYFFDKTKRHYGEMGAMRIPVSHGTTWHYINLFHLISVPMYSPDSNNIVYMRNRGVRRDKEDYYLKEYLYPEFALTQAEKSISFTELSDYAYSSILRTMPAEIKSEFFQILPAYSKEYAAYLNLSNRQVLERLGLSQDAIALLAGVNPLAGGLLNTSYGETLQEVYSLDYNNLYRLSGGMDTLPKAFYDSLTSKEPSEYELSQEDLGNVDFKQGHVVTGIYNTSEQNSILLKYTNKSKKETLEVFDYVICAIPFSTLREIDINPLFSNQKMQAIRELNYVDALKASFLCNKRFWEEDADYGRMNGGISTTDLPIQSIIYPTDHVNCADNAACLPLEPGVLTASYNVNYDSVRIGNQNEERRYHIIRQNVEQVHGLTDGYLTKFIDDIKIVDWNKESWARGAFVTDLPGQKINFAYSILEPEYNNHLFFAGEHTSIKHGWMQGALHSGMLAANTLAYNKKMNDRVYY